MEAGRVDILIVANGMSNFRAVSMLGVALSAGLTGCFKTIHYVPQTQAPAMFPSAGVDVLQKKVSDRDAAIQTLNASVVITASTGGGHEGQVTTITPFRG